MEKDQSGEEIDAENFGQEICKDIRRNESGEVLSEKGIEEVGEVDDETSCVREGKPTCETE